MRSMRATSLTLLATFAIARTARAQCAHHDTTRTNLAGRTETATIWVMSSPDSGGDHWTPTANPAPIGAAPPACIRTSLEVRLGGTALPAGRYQLLWEAADGGIELVVRAAPAPGDPPVAREEYRIPVSVVRGAPLRFADIRVQTLRQGPDTVGVVDRSTRQRDITELQLHPGTTSVLLIRIGDATVSIPISAR